MEAGDVEPAGAMGSPAATSAEEACDVMPPATKSGDMPPATQDAPKPSRRGRAKFKTMGAVTNFSVQARDWTQEKPRKIWVKEKQGEGGCGCGGTTGSKLSLIHISEPTRLLSISYAVFCLKKKKNL
eukprot:TRINITY_DN7792_c0_g1_i2.p1 TRINITY_DN7792_c0_g1~~TRINITY_DN7792_c0_g1_i2.p1  ORF type:complete len:127 (+),score=26.59 TRINITY_DN7792_c0_g1_i2:222-602(+)